MADIPLDTFDKVPNEFGSAAAQPKRPVGRPPGSGARRGRPPRRASAATRADANAVYQSVGFLVVLADQGAAYGIPAWDKQRLTPTEIGALAKALGDEALTNEKVALWLTKVSTSNTHIALASVVAAIMLPRMAAAGMFPVDTANAIAVQVGTRTTPFTYRDDWEREIDFSSEDSGSPPIRSDIPKQSGQGEIPEYDYSKNGGFDDEFATESSSTFS